MLRCSPLAAVTRFSLVALALLLATPGAHSQQQVRQFQATVSRVQVDLIVTDANGEFIEDLRLDELAVFEDDRPQRLLDVELVDLGVREAHRLASASAPSASVEPGASRLLRPGELGAVVFLIDLPGLFWEDKNRFADALVALQRKADELRVPYAAYVVSQVGELYELVPLTYSVARLLESGSELRATPLTRTRDDIFRVLESYLAPATGDVANAQRRTNNVQARGRSFDAYEMLSRVVSSLAARNGRTALVWVSHGVELGYMNLVERIPSGAQTLEERRQRRTLPGGWMTYQPDPRVEQMADEFHRLANSSNVSVYPVDPRLLRDFYPSPQSGRAGSSEDTAGNSLRHVAEATGGEASVGATDLQGVLGTIEQDAGRFYLLTYAPSHDAGDGEYHEIRVEVSRPDAEVRARGGYHHYTDDDRRARMIRGALDLPGVVAGFDIDVVGIRARDAAGQALLIVDTAVPGGQTMPTGAGQPSLASESMVAQPHLIYEIVRNADDELVATIEGERLVPEGDGATATGISDSGVGSHLRHRAVHKLGPGSFDVRIAVVDPRTGRIGAAKLEVEIADAAGEWDASDPWLTFQDTKGRMWSAVGDSFALGQRAGVYVEVYRGGRPALSGRIWDRAGADTPRVAERPDISELEQAQVSAAVTPVLLANDGGIHRGTLWLPELPPGSYVLEVRVDDPSLSRDRTTLLPFSVLAEQ